MTNSKKNNLFAKEGYVRWKRSMHLVGEFKDIPTTVAPLTDEEAREMELDFSISVEADGFFREGELGEDVLTIIVTIRDQTMLLNDEELYDFLKNNRNKKKELFALTIRENNITINCEEFEMIDRKFDYLMNP